jgi:ABC-type spermidine/putrescine transport system permease subunit II
LLVDMRGGPAPVITFPVRYSLVFPSLLARTTAASAASTGEDEKMRAAQSLKEAPVQALRQLLLSVAASGFASSSFLTFWRGRTETLDASDVARIYEYFPSATVDRD